MAKVSVIIPVYGVEKLIERCARSLFEQTLDDIEYLFIDDCSPDRSIEVLERVLNEYPQRRPQVIIHRMEKNSGQAKVREWGMQNVTGEYVIHCDSDDWIDRTLYETLYVKAKENHAEVSICDCVNTNGKNTYQVIKGCSNAEYSIFFERIIFQKESWSLCNKLFSREACYSNLVFPKGNMGEDMVLCVQLLSCCTRLAYAKDVYYYYYRNEDSISNRQNPETHVRNFESLKANTDFLIGYLDNISIKKKQWAINSLQYNATFPLLNLICGNKKYRQIWMNTYPGANLRFVFNPYALPQRRFMCFLQILGLHPFKKDRIYE